jgi:hypothetical protein
MASFASVGAIAAKICGGSDDDDDGGGCEVLGAREAFGTKSHEKTVANEHILSLLNVLE